MGSPRLVILVLTGTLLVLEHYSGPIARSDEPSTATPVRPESWQEVDARLQRELNQRISQLNPEQRRELDSADELNRQGALAQRSGDLAAAQQKMEQALSLYTKVLGRSNSRTLDSLANVIQCQLERAEFRQSLPLIKEILELQPQLQGNLHPATVRTLALLARFNESVGSFQHAEDAYRRIVELLDVLTGPAHAESIAARVELGRVLSEQRKFQDAQPLLAQSLRKQIDLLGEEHLSVAQTRKILGTMYCRQKNYAAAGPLLEQSSRSLHRTLDDKHIAVASADNALGRFRAETGQLEQAERDLKGSLATCIATYGEQHPATGKVLDNLAFLYEAATNTGLARQLRHQCLLIAEQTYGETNVLTADALVNLARTYLVMNDFGLAETYLLRARETRRKLLGEDHPQTAVVVGKLAYVYLGVNDPERAVPLFEEALRVLEKSSDEPLETARSHKHLALLFQSTGKFDAAERHYRQAVRLMEQLAGPSHSAVAEVKVGLAQTLLSRGEVTEARQTMDEVLPVYAKQLHQDDPQWIDALAIGGVVYLAAQETGTARSLVTRALDNCLNRLRQSSAYESERQRLAQMLIMRDTLDLYLSLPRPKGTGSAECYPYVLTWKGAVAARQWHDRKCSSAESAPLTLELQRISRQLSALSLNAPETGEQKDWIGRIFSLNMRKEALEEKRSLLNHQQCGPPADIIPDDLRRALPAGTVLIDFLQYQQTSFTTDKDLQMVRKPRYIAFAIRADRPVELIELGDAAPLVEAVSKWRQTRGFRPDKGKTDWASVVGELLLPALKPHLKDCEIVLISPDGILSHLAWNVLPGKKPDSYLIEDHAIALVPVPQLLPSILKERLGTNAVESKPDSLLLVGDIDFNAVTNPDAGSSQPTHQELRFHFAPLKGTAAEAQALRSQFQQRFPRGELMVLTQAAATETAFWYQAPRHRWLHIATHGFFAPASIKAAIATQNRMTPSVSPQERVSVFHVGYLNGLALAGANVGTHGDGDDGILTAAELATMDLRQVEVAVLSGCETGLGEIQSGEGAFGMQRALQVAGVGATIGSLWSVPDEKTNLLMQRFYANLWDKKLPRLAALREAQLWLLNSSGGPVESASASSRPKRLSPHYWAAFTLSGDWR